MDQGITFRELCRQHRLAATHQRRAIYDAVVASPGHPSPELIYSRVRKNIPSISLATVYKNIQTFIESGMLREVSVHHGAMRMEPNRRAHHHLVCMQCRSISDLEEEKLAPIKFRNPLPRGFQVKRISVDILGICAVCARQPSKAI